MGREDPVEHQTGTGPEIHHPGPERPRKRQLRLRRQFGDAARLLAEPLPRQRPRRRRQPGLHHHLVGIARDLGPEIHLDELPAQNLHRRRCQLPAHVQLCPQRERHDPLHAKGAAEERSGASLPQAERRGPRDLLVRQPLFHRGQFRLHRQRNLRQEESFRFLPGRRRQLFRLQREILSRRAEKGDEQRENPPLDGPHG